MMSSLLLGFVSTVLRAPRALRSLAAIVAASVAIAGTGGIQFGCAAKAADSGVHQPLDYDENELGIPFDPNAVLDTGSMTDSLTFDAISIQAFLERTPYKRASFLSTYQSNGVRAADAVARAAALHRINPLVILVRAQMDEGLIGEQYYPFPPSRVEYAFGCGCPGVGRCDPAQAGFDRQAECLARTVRHYLDEIARDGVTSGGWGPGVRATTLDRKLIDPSDEATAALYQYTPLVGDRKSGNHLFFNIWQNYAFAMDYTGPLLPDTGGSWIGGPCQADPMCAAPDSFCALNFPGGMCTSACAGDCPREPGRPESFCADFGDELGGYCLQICNSGVPGSCRDGYECAPVYRFGGTQETREACIKKE